jgi:hypothetical protein
MKQYSRFTFTKIGDTGYDSFAVFFNLSKDNLFVNLSAVRLARYAERSTDCYADTISNLLGFMNMHTQTMNRDTHEIIEDEEQPKVWRCNDGLINRIQHLTLPQWALEAEFSCNTHHTPPYYWKEYLFTMVLDINLPELRSVTLIDDSLPVDSPILARAAVMEYGSNEELTLEMQRKIYERENLTPHSCFDGVRVYVFWMAPEKASLRAAIWRAMKKTEGAEGAVETADGAAVRDGHRVTAATHPMRLWSLWFASMDERRNRMFVDVIEEGN